MPIEFNDGQGGKRVEDIERKVLKAYPPGAARILPTLPMWVGFIAAIVIAFMAGRQSVGEKIIEIEKPVNNVPAENLRRISVLTTLLRAETGNSAPFRGIQDIQTSNNVYVAFKFLDRWAKSPTFDQTRDVESMKDFMPERMWERLK